jgi:ribosomal protein L23
MVKNKNSSISLNDIEKSIKIIDIARKEAIDNKQWGFEDNWIIFNKRMRILTNQSSGSRIQNYIFKSLDWTKIPASLNKGDVKNTIGQYFEVKVTSITTSNTMANIVQIRLWQNVSGYHIFVIDSTKNYQLTHFHLSKNEMKEESKWCAKHAHGTKESNKENNHIEWAIRIPWKKGDKVYDRWMKKYKQDTDIANN